MKAAISTPSVWRATGTPNAAKSCANALPVITRLTTLVAILSALVITMSLTPIQFNSRTLLALDNCCCLRGHCCFTTIVV